MRAKAAEKAEREHKAALEKGRRAKDVATKKACEKEAVLKRKLKNARDKERRTQQVRRPCRCNVGWYHHPVRMCVESTGPAVL